MTPDTEKAAEDFSRALEDVLAYVPKERRAGLTKALIDAQKTMLGEVLREMRALAQAAEVLKDVADRAREKGRDPLKAIEDYVARMRAEHEKGLH